MDNKEATHREQDLVAFHIRRPADMIHIVVAPRDVERTVRAVDETYK